MANRATATACRAVRLAAPGFAASGLERGSHTGAARRSRTRPDGGRSRPTPVRHRWLCSAAAAGLTRYLNATPKQGAETLANWSRFRPEHNRGEGNRHVRLEASADDLRFRSGRGSCVVDSYTTSKAAYREIACLVADPTASAVVVAAAQVGLWEDQAATLQRAVSSFVP